MTESLSLLRRIEELSHSQQRLEKLITKYHSSSFLGRMKSFLLQELSLSEGTEEDLRVELDRQIADLSETVKRLRDDQRALELCREESRAKITDEDPEVKALAVQNLSNIEALALNCEVLIGNAETALDALLVSRKSL